MKEVKAMTNGKTKLRFLAVVMTLCMALTLLPVSSSAAGQAVTYSQVDNSVLSAEVTQGNGSFLGEEDAPPEDETVRAVIFLKDASLVDSGYSTMGLADNAAAMAYSDKLVNTQDSVIRRIETNVLKGEALDVIYQFTIGVNAVAVSVPYGKLDEIAKVQGVDKVLLDTLYELPQEPADPDTGTSGEMVQSYSTWADGYTGAGSRIAIIDTGIDRDHPSFSEEGFYYGLATSAARQGKSIADYDLLTLEDVEALLPRLHVNPEDNPEKFSAADLYTNAKIPFGFNYMAETADYNCDAISGDHGCHVAGIAAANTYVLHLDADGDPYYAPQDQGATGVAPNAQVLVMKVFSDGWGAFEADYMAALEDAILLGCDSVNLSLGSAAAGRSFSSTYGVLLNSLLETDTVMTNSAGNNGSWADNEVNGIGLTRTEDIRTNTGGSPGSYRQSFAIASADNIAITGIVGNYNGYIAAVTDTGDTYGAAPFQTLDTSGDGSGTEYPYVFLGDPETGEGIHGLPEDFEGVDLTGKIVLISRGNSSFFEKANLAVEHGAVATVIYNNVDGTINMNLTGYLFPNPAVSMSKADGDAIFAASVKNEETGLWEGKVTVTSIPQTVYLDTEHDTMSSFSSWGCGDDLGLKPELTAPGGNIYSTLDNGSYGLMSGTSMAAPSATGAAAVVAQYIKENGLAEKTGLSVRELTIALLMSTARTMVDSDTGLPFSPRQQGAGLTQIYEAVTAPSYLLVGQAEGNDGKVKLELGDDPQRTGVYTGSFSINNFSDEDQIYSFDSDIFTSAAEAIDGVDYMSKQGYALEPAVTFETEAPMTYVYDLNGDGAVDAQDAMVLLKAANGTGPALTGDKANLFDFDADGVITTTDAQLLLAATQGDTTCLDAGSSTYTVAAGTSVEVKFTITLSGGDKAYFEAHYPNGGYVDGFLYANSENGDGKQLSVPLLAFYGNWSDASMYEHWNLLEDENNENATPSYMTDSPAMNYFTVKFKGSTAESVYFANSWATDEAYIADRNSINNRATLYRVFPTLLRNTANLTVTIRDAETGEEYFTKSLGMGTGAYYYTNGGVWQGLGSGYTIDWKVLDAEGNRLEEGTQVEVVVRAATEYNWQYLWDEAKDGYDYLNGSVVGELGEGAYWKTVMTVDNTAPVANSIAVTADSITGERSMKVKVQDNRYTAAVLLISQSNAVLARSAVNQTEPGAECTVDFDLSEIYTNDFYVGVIDYAGNLSTYAVNVGGEIRIPDTNTVLSAALQKDQGQWFVQLDVDEQTFEALHETAGEIPVLSVARSADGTLYAASQEVVDGYLVSSLYTVNEDYTLTRVGETQELGFTDMSWAPTVNGGSLMATYGKYVLVVDTATGGYLGAWDITTYTGGASAVALAYAQTVPNDSYGQVDIFLMMDSKGMLYQTGFAVNPSTGQYTIFKPTAMLQVPNVYNTFYGSSMYCEDGMLYISALSASGESVYSQLVSADLTSSNLWLFDRGRLNTAPVCIYGATAKESGQEATGSLRALQSLGEAVEARSDVSVDLCPAQQLGR